jgi:hypothetical protein
MSENGDSQRKVEPKIQATFIAAVHTLLCIWCTLMGFEVEGILQREDFNRHLSSIQVERFLGCSAIHVMSTCMKGFKINNTHG